VIDGLMARSRQSLASAGLLFEADDMNGTCDRACYAMFNAARAVLLAQGHEAAANSKTHSGLIAAFSKNVIRENVLDPRFGRQFNEALQARLIADYGTDSIALESARRILASAEEFVAAIQSKLGNIR
jgi:uncharacterized protein (UPF0332 family)